MFEKLKYFSTIFFGTFIIAVGVYFFMNPNHIVSGSISGLAVVLVNFVPLSLSVMTLFLNIICIIWRFSLSIRLSGQRSSLSPSCCRYFSSYLNRLPGSGISDGEHRPGCSWYDRCDLFRTGDPLQRQRGIRRSRYYREDHEQISPYGSRQVDHHRRHGDGRELLFRLRSSDRDHRCLATYFSGLVLDYFIDEFTGKIRVCVISEHNDEFRRYVIENLQRGITVYTATGGYSDAQKSEILAILTKKEYGQFMDYVQSKDPNAFVTISNVKRVVGSWNTPKRRTYF